MRVLVTGGAGFLGRSLVRALVQVGDEVTVLDSLVPEVHPPGAEPDLPPEAHLLRGEVQDPAAVREAVQGCELIFHLAACTGTGQSMYQIARYTRSNVAGTAQLLEALLPLRPRPRLVLASSRAVLGEGRGLCPQCGPVYPPLRRAEDLAQGRWEPCCPGCGGETRPRPTPEDAPPAPASVYGATKLAQEHLVQAVAGATGLEALVLRIQNVYGPGQPLANPYTGLLGAFCNRIRAGLPPELYEDGEASRDLVHSDDVVRAFLAARQTRSGGCAVCNIGSGRFTTLRELARALAPQGPEPTVTGAYRPGDVRHAAADITRAAALLGWHPQVPLAEGLVAYRQWADSQPPCADRTREALDELHRRLAREDP